MGKISTKDAKDKMRHKPLYKDITETGHLKVGKRLKHDKTVEEDAEDDFVLDAASSRKVLKLAREQQEEIALEENRLEVSERPRFQMIAHESDESDDDAVYEAMSDDDENEYYDEEVEEVDEQDAKLFESYFKSENNAFGSFNLADKVMSKLQETQQQKAEQTEKPQDKVFLPPRVIEAYEKVGQSLHVWRHGKLPKLFKVLPSIKNWEDLIFVTNPEAWTPQVTYEATRLFVSNLTASKAERFVNLNSHREKVRITIPNHRRPGVLFHAFPCDHGRNKKRHHSRRRHRDNRAETDQGRFSDAARLAQSVSGIRTTVQKRHHRGSARFPHGSCQTTGPPRDWTGNQT
ncbi:hypothetical protein KL905_001903 [Ogataea polymorpha]|nr:hypothetical protein KL937_000375 [Ogataea polymorpha]KAG7896234.1 hypothetical protein KL908_000748 [Ogataea polymorpha]KAG7904034.1 hypothetical protein KL935_000173 [Ogataea polymorpha]KAG7908463.1 hypothetical protein KL907_001953 [Ogataea polymorpha]KAG7920928.1 hypothetical protein KL927_000172 [Ogataea polymorpha]